MSKHITITQKYNLDKEKQFEGLYSLALKLASSKEEKEFINRKIEKKTND